MRAAEAPAERIKVIDDARSLKAGEDPDAAAGCYEEGPCRKPKRPHIPLALWCLVALIVVEWLVLSFRPDGRTCTIAFSLLVAGAFASLAAWRQGLAYGMAGLAIAVCAILGLAVSLARSSLDACAAEKLARSSASSYEVVITGDPSPGGRGGLMARASVQEDGRAFADVWLMTSEEVRLGDRIRCVGRFSAAADDGWGHSSRSQGIVGSLSAKMVLAREVDPGLLGALMALRERAVAAIGPEASSGRAILAGSICGDRSQMKESGLSDLFSACGVSHLVAVSGGHIAIVSAVLAAMLARTRLRPTARSAIVLGASGLFVAFTGLAISAARAWLMACAGLVGQAASRRGEGTSSACLVCLGMAAADPACAGHLSFLLSMTSVIGLCLLAPYLRYALRVIGRPACGYRHAATLMRHAPRPIRQAVRRMGSAGFEALVATLACQLATLPLTAAAFGTLSLVAPAANVLMALPFQVMMILGLAGACLAWAPCLADSVIRAAAMIGDGCAAMLSWLARAPLATVAVTIPPWALACAVWGLLAVILWRWPTLRGRMVRRAVLVFLMAMLAIFIRLRFLNPARVVILDVGQGDAILIQDGSHALLVDAGPAGNLAPALARQGVLHLDGVVLTHLHDDHAGGLADLAAGVHAGRVYVARGVAEAMTEAMAKEADAASGLPPQEVAYGDVLRVGGFRLRVASPKEDVDGAENADSIELAGSYERAGKELSFLLTGDAEREETAACIRRGDVGDIDLLKVGHHGSAVSIDEEAAKALDPEVSVASAGEGNSYGHPTPECVGILESSGSAFLCTKDVGDVDVRPGASGPRVICGRRSAGGDGRDGGGPGLLVR